MRTRALCGISMGTPPFAIYWLKDSLPIISASHRLEVKLLDEFTSVLTISNLSMADAGLYECVAKNDFFEVKHGSYLALKVSAYWKKEPLNATATADQPVFIDCVADGHPEPVVRWYRVNGIDEHDSRPLPKYRVTAGGYQLPNGTLQITSVQKYDGGKYQCKAVNDLKTPLFKLVYVSVTSSPRFLSSPRKFSVRSKESVTLLCEVEGTVPVEITWQKNGMKVQQDSRMTVNTSLKKSGVTSALAISSVYPNDAGIFVCIASNHYGWSHLEITVGIQEPPPPPEAVRATEVKSRQTTITWKVQSVEILKSFTFYLQYKTRDDVQWSEIKLPRIPLDRKYEYVLQNMIPATPYKVRLFSETLGGRSVASEVATLMTFGEAPSSVPHDVKVAVVSSTAIKISWMGITSNNWNSDRIGYTIDGKVEGRNIQPVAVSVPPSSDTSPGQEVIVSHLVPFSRYTFTVIGLNQYGFSGRSGAVTAQTLEEAPSVFPANVQCVVLSSTSVRVIWEEPSSVGVNGAVEGYKTFYEPENSEKGMWKNEVKVSPSSPVVLTGLEPATTYRIRVAVFNRAATGPMSPQTFATTHEEGPNAPADVKVIVASTSRVTVCWSTPAKPNGVITQYSIYYRSAVSAVQPAKDVVPGSILEHEINSLISQHPYEFWVRASTKAGSGESSKVVRQIIYTKDGQGICSWGKSVKAFENTEVELPCKAVCSTSCRWYWIYNKQNVSASDRIYIQDRDFLRIKNLRASDSGNYSCVLKSHLGLESIKYTLLVHKVPSVQYIDALSIDQGRISLKWSTEPSTSRMIRRFLLHHREEGGEWEENEVDGTVNSYEYPNLLCGRTYQFYIVAIADVTAGPASAVASAQLRGKRPGPAPPSQALLSHVNSSYVVLNLSQWPSGGCQISGYDVEYRIEGESWSDYWRNMVSLPRLYLYDLQPSTSYVVRVTATNQAGPLSHEYTFVTLDENGYIPSQSKVRRGKVISDLEDALEESGQTSQFDLPFWLLVASSILGTFSLMGLALVCHLFRKHTISQSESTMVALDSSRSYSGTLRKEGKETVRQVDSTSEIDYSRDDRKEEDHYEVVRPYATFELQRRSPSRQAERLTDSAESREEFPRSEKTIEVFYEPKRLYRRPPPIDGESDYESFPYGTHSRPPPSYHTGTVISRTESAELLDFETFDRRQAEKSSTFINDGTAKLRSKNYSQLPADQRFKPVASVKRLY